MREETLAIVRRMQDNEATDQRVYAALAKQASLQKNSEILEKMSHDEGLHCAVWGRYTGIEAKADMRKSSAISARWCLASTTHWWS